MTTSIKTHKWRPGELKKIVDADDLKISPFRKDGTTYGTPTWIWNVTVKGDIYVRAYHGQKSSWYQAALHQKAGRIHTAGMVIEVAFIPVDGNINSAIDSAYKRKYKNSPFLKAMISDKVKSATIKILPIKKQEPRSKNQDPRKEEEIKKIKSKRV